MKVLLVMFMALVGPLRPVAATGEPFTVGEALIIKYGKLSAVTDTAAISKFVMRYSGTDGSVAPVKIGARLQEGDSLLVKAGMNLGLRGKNREMRWINYNSSARFRGGNLTIDGEVLALEDHPKPEPAEGEKAGLLGLFVKLRGIGTKYYLSTRDEMDVVYVLDGKVEVKHANNSKLELDKGDAAEASDQGIRKVDLFEADVARIEKWRDDVEWAQMSFWGKLFRFPLHHPIITVAACAVVGGVVAYEVGRDDSELTVQVTVPDTP